MLEALLTSMILSLPTQARLLPPIVADSEIRSLHSVARSLNQMCIGGEAFGVRIADESIGLILSIRLQRSGYDVRRVEIARGYKYVDRLIIYSRTQTGIVEIIRRGRLGIVRYCETKRRREL